MRPSLVTGCLLLPLVFPVSSAAQLATAPPPADSPARLKLSPVLEPPPPKLPAATPASPVAPGTEAIFLRADSIGGNSEQWLEASGKVELRGRRDTVLADWLRYDAAANEFWGKGNVVLRRGLDWMSGPEARLKRDTETGFFAEPQYHIGENASHGSASEILFKGPNEYEIKDARYTTCVAPNEDWYLQSRDVEIDKSRLVATARHATVYFKDVPILYAPWLEFPLSSERKSGFLTPTFGSTNNRGFEMSLPYYWNIAPNLDATITPRLMTRRGLQLNTQGRYLFPNVAGEADVEILPNDRVTGTRRYGLSWKHNENFAFAPGLAGFLNLNKVSDDTYFSDLSDRLAVTSQTTLPREAGFTYNRGPFSVLARTQSFQTLQDPNQPITPPYFREPQLLVNMNPVEWKGLEVAATSEFVRFRHPTLVDGDRSVLYPTLTWNQRGNAWFFTARTGLHMSHYDFADPGLEEQRLNRTVPITSVDGGLTFERNADFFGRSYVQTLEPRAYYVYIPYRQQSQIPAFDTAIDDFNFSQLFTENRYLGSDRIGDANQFTLAVVSRLIDPNTADERMRFAIGQRFYFESQRVTLTEQPRSANSSDLLIAAEGRLSDYWAAATALEYNVNNPEVERFDAGLRWQPGAGRVLNASYRYIRQQVDPTGAVSQLKQVDLSGQWPLFNNWSLLGRWNYSLADSKTLEAVVGVEYNGDCWAVRVVGQRLATTVQQTNSSIFIQFELNGLARFGTNPLELLRRSVPGYLKINDPTLRPTGAGPADYFPQF